MARELSRPSTHATPRFVGKQLVGADFLGGRVVRFPTDSGGSPAATTLLRGVTSPTSVRRGCVVDSEHGLSERLYFVSEGGALSHSKHDRRVLAFSAL